MAKKTVEKTIVLLVRTLMIRLKTEGIHIRRKMLKGKTVRSEKI